MPRPKKCRRIGFIPQNECFAPCGMKGGARGEVVMSIEEMEALRLSDLERLDQNACAAQMGISRGTFQRIINNARQKTANALVNALSIRIDPGLLVGDKRTIICRSCGYTWKENTDSLLNEQCNICGCINLAYISDYDCCPKHSTSCLERKGNLKMKLALGVVGEQVSCHFGSCESFVICEIQGTEVIDKKVVGTEGNQHGALPGYLAGLGVNAVIAATMGGGAMRKLADLGIEFYQDVNGHVDQIIQQFINNELIPTEYDPNVHACNHSHGEGHNNEHQHEHHHGESHGCGCGGN